MNIKLAPISSGIIYGEFKDQSGLLCSIEESTHTKANCIWLGCQSMIGGDPSMRMLLTQEMAAALIPPLQLFVEHGCLDPNTTIDEAFKVPEEAWGKVDRSQMVLGRILTDEELELLKQPLFPKEYYEPLFPKEDDE